MIDSTLPNDAQYEMWKERGGKFANPVNWKASISHTFPFKYTNEAEDFASWIVWHHGVEPIIIIDHSVEMIYVETTGYAC